MTVPARVGQSYPETGEKCRRVAAVSTSSQGLHEAPQTGVDQATKGFRNPVDTSSTLPTGRFTRALGTADDEFVRAARRGQHGVHVPRRWRDALDAQEYALLVVLLSMRTGRSRQVTVGQRTIATKLGRSKGSRTDHVGRVAQRLVEEGALARTRTARGVGITRYELLDQDGRYDVIPWALLHALAAGECTAGEIHTYAYLTHAMGALGRTTDTAAELAAQVGVSPRTIRRHVALLELLGLVRVRTVPAAAGLWLVERVDEHESAPVTEVESSTDEVVEATSSPSAEISGREASRALVGDTDVERPDTDVGSQEKSLTPESLAPENPLGSLVVDRQVSKRESGHTSGLRPKGGVFSGPGCAEVLTGLAGTAWRAPEARRWLGGVLSQAVVPALEQGMSAAAVVWALRSHGEDELLERGTSHVGIARQAIAEVRIDIRLGHACHRCGRIGESTGETALVDGEHSTCPTADVERHEEDQAQVPVEQRLAACQGLGMTRAQVADIDPAAAELWDSTTVSSC